MAATGIIDRTSNTSEQEQPATLQALLGDAGRKGAAVPVRRAFVQQGTQRNAEPGPLQAIVRHQDDLALNLYLLFMAQASKEPWDVVRDARVWGRAVGHGTDLDAGSSIVSKAWRRLDETYNLIRRERSGRLAQIFALDEAGTREAYTYPERQYFKIPFAYWTDDQAWHRTLTLPAKASLLIALSLPRTFRLPAERGPWYGISAVTLDRGLRELRDVGLLGRSLKVVKDYRAGTMEVTTYDFQLKGAFAKPKRAERHLRAVGE